MVVGLSSDMFYPAAAFFFLDLSREAILKSI